MHSISLKFNLKSLEDDYNKSLEDENNYAYYVIFTFNIILIAILGVLCLISQDYMIFFFSLVSEILISITFILMKIRKIRSRFYDITLFFLILYPYFVGVYFTFNKLPSPTESFTAGFVYNMYLSFPIRVKISWYKKLLIHIPAYLYIEIFAFQIDQKITFSFIAILIIMFLNVIFDFYQDRMQRKTYLIEHHFKKNNEVFQHMFTNIIPEEILIWKKSGLDFANKQAFELFHVKNKEELEPILLKNIEIIENGTSDNFIPMSSLHNPSKERLKKFRHDNTLLLKIHQILKNDQKEESPFEIFTAKVLIPKVEINFNIENQINKNQEFDIKMKKFFWDSEDAVLILLNAVEERNLKSRLAFVNSYLNYFLANLSHEIYTPLNGILGMLEVSLNELKGFSSLRENLVVAKNSADFLLVITQDLFDFYNIRRGHLVINISQINLELYLKELILIFESHFAKQNVKIENFMANKIIHSDSQKLKQIFVGIINNIVNTLIVPCLSINVLSVLGGSDVIIEIKAIGQAINSIKISDMTTSNKLSKQFSLNWQTIKSERTNFGGSLELHLIRYLTLSLAPGTDIPFQKKMSKSSEPNMMECFYQIYLSDLKDRDSKFIEDKTNENRHSFQAEYKMQELFESDDSPSLIMSENIKSAFLKSEKSNFFHKLEGDSENFDEHKKEDISLKSFLDCHIQQKRSNTFTMSGVSNNSKPIRLFEDHNDIMNYSYNNISLGFESPKRKKKPEYIILNVDDNLINLTVITHYCKISGFRVIEALNGVDAVEKARNLYTNERKYFDMVFMDCDMPIMDGFLACEELIKFYSENKMKETIPVIAITANDTYDDRMKAKNCGMKELVKKPLSKKKFNELTEIWVRKM